VLDFTSRSSRLLIVSRPPGPRRATASPAPRPFRTEGLHLEKRAFEPSPSRRRRYAGFILAPQTDTPPARTGKVVLQQFQVTAAVGRGELVESIEKMISGRFRVRQWARRLGRSAVGSVYSVGTAAFVRPNSRASCRQSSPAVTGCPYSPARRPMSG